MSQSTFPLHVKNSSEILFAVWLLEFSWSIPSRSLFIILKVRQRNKYGFLFPEIQSFELTCLFAFEFLIDKNKFELYFQHKIEYNIMNNLLDIFFLIYKSNPIGFKGKNCTKHDLMHIVLDDLFLQGVNESLLIDP